MHGIIFNELRKFSNARFGDGTWEALLSKSGVPTRTYLATRSYPDEELSALVGAATAATGIEAPPLLEIFGEFIAPDLLAMFRSLIRRDWTALDVLQQTEETIHKVVRVQYADAAPPYLQSERVSPAHVRIHYTSPRRLCFVAKGIIRGVAKEYAEQLVLQETRCMHRGDAECLLEVRAK